MKLALNYTLYLQFHHKHKIEESYFKFLNETFHNNYNLFGPKGHSIVENKIVSLNYDFLYRHELMQFIDELYKSSVINNYRLVASENHLREINDFYFYVLISTNFAFKELPENWKRKDWGNINQKIYGYSLLSKIYEGLANEYSLYRKIQHPLAEYESVEVKDSKGNNYEILKDTFLKIW